MTAGRRLATTLLAAVCATSVWALSRGAAPNPGPASRSIESFRQEALRNPQNDAALYELSRACAEQGDRRQALNAIKKALELKPKDLTYLRAGARLASWNGEDAYALELYYRILALRPNDGPALLGLARVENWLGKVDDSVRDYQAYIKAHPKDRKARIEFAQVVTWRGGYGQAMKVLESYRKDFGADADYERQKAVVLALAKKSGAAIAIAEPMLQKNPKDYTLTYARTIALANGRRPKEALKSLQRMEELKPSAPLTKNTRLFVTTPLRSTLGATVGYSSDSDDLGIWNYSLHTRIAASPVTFVTAGAQWDDLSARVGSGLERLDGNPDAWQRRGWIGLSHRFSPYAALDLSLGGAEVQSRSSIMTYGIGADFNPSDSVGLRLSRSYGFYLISPRALSLDIRRTANRLELHSDMGLNYHMDAEGAYDTFSDGNRMWDLAVAPRRAIVRTGTFNFDLGLRAWWFGFKEDYGHGYYSPNLYQRYSLMGFGYWKIDDNDGIGFVLAPGYFKDSTMSGFKFGFNASLQGTFGIYRNWMLQVSVSHIDNSRVASGAYRGTAAQVSLLRRF